MRMEDKSSKTQLDAASDFLEHRALLAEECGRLRGLVERYKSNIPKIAPVWDITDDAVQFNDICGEGSAFNLYEDSMANLWNGIFQPQVYEANTIWSDDHDSKKIAQVLDCWENQMPLSPIFLVRHGTKDLALVADGKHRLTVSRVLKSTIMYFIVKDDQSSWVASAFPHASFIRKICI